jgi:hypothetical protein
MKSRPRESLAHSANGPQPVIEVVFDQFGRLNHYVPGGVFRVVGRGFGTFSDVPSDLGLYLASEQDGRLIQVLRYSAWRDGEIEGLWPVGPRGPQRLILETRSANGRTASATFGEPLLP